MSKRPPPRASFRTLPTPPDNPIQLAELTHLERSPTRRSVRPLLVLFVVPLTASLVLSAALYFMGRSGNVGGVDLAERYARVQSFLGVANAMLSLMVLSLNALLIWELLLYASDGIAREKRHQTWETLVLTPLSAWQIVTGKWRAAQAFLYRHFGVLMLLRVVAVLWMALTTGSGSPFAFAPDVLLLIVAVAVIALFLALNLALAGAVALLASFLPVAMPAVGSAMVLLFSVGVGMATINLGVLRLAGLLELASPFGLGQGAAFAWLVFDGGTSAALQLLYSTQAEAPLFLLGLSAANALLYGLLVWGLLWLARWLAVRQGALA